MKIAWKYAQQPPTVRSALQIIGALAVVQVLLAGTLIWLAVRPHPVVVVPGTPRSMVSIPETIPLGAARRFALLYLTYFDDYTPASIEERSNLVLRYVAAENHEQATKTLSERASYVFRSREASQLVLPMPEICTANIVDGGLVEVRVVAMKRTYIAGSLKEERKIRYVLLLRSATPTDDDPYGFVIARQSVEAVESPDSKTGSATEVPDAGR